jgi:hypothetical protein
MGRWTLSTSALEQITDILTKPLPRDHFYEIRVKLGVVKISKELQA